MFKTRVIVVVCVLAVPMSAVLWRMFDIQVIHGSFYSEESRKQAQQRTLLFAKRGDIRDRKGRVLSTSVGAQVKMSASLLASQQDSSDDTARGSVTLHRMYPYGDIAGQVLGYVGRDGAGLGGAEFYYDKFLKGENGWAVVLRDARNRRYSTMNLPHQDPVTGNDVYLTIDVDIQKIAENVMRQTVSSLSAKGGMCIVLEPSTGKILAMVNEPAFNPNMPSRYALDLRQNKCIGYTYEPGSTFKLITAACALQEKVKKWNDTIDGNHGVYEIYDQKIRDEKPYGKLSFTDALCYSSNVCFAKIATAIGNERLYKYARDFGLGDRTGIRLPGEEDGTVHPIDKWSGRTLVTMAIGQEVSVTLLQMVMTFAAIANDGILCEPRICDRIVNANGATVDSSETKPVRRVVSSAVAAQLKSMLAEVVKRGTAVKAAVPGVVVVGKTGTAQKIDKATGSYSNIRGWSSFIGFTPPEKPLLLCAVLIDDPLRGEMGATAAAPAFSKIVSQIISHPQLEYAERMLPRPTARETKALTQKNDSAQTAPLVSGMPVGRATEVLTEESIAYEVIGAGQQVDYQVPAQGTPLHNGTKMLLYTSRPDSAHVAAGAFFMPDCRGRDLRDAINCVNQKGLVPFVIGAGTVRRQNPEFGAFVKHADVCTLFCAFADVGKKL